MQQQAMVGLLCGHTQLIIKGWALPLPQLDGASMLAPLLDRSFLLF